MAPIIVNEGIEAESLDEAEKVAQGNPYIASIRVYEMREM
jgi:hypothetical protein